MRKGKMLALKLRCIVSMQGFIILVLTEYRGLLVQGHLWGPYRLLDEKVLLILNALSRLA